MNLETGVPEAYGNDAPDRLSNVEPASTCGNLRLCWKGSRSLTRVARRQFPARGHRELANKRRFSARAASRELRKIPEAA